MPIPRLVFSHQDGILGFRIVETTFIVAKGHLSLSLSCAGNRRHDFMDEPQFAAFNLQLVGTIRAKQVFEIKNQFVPGGALDVPRAHVYAGEHFQPRNTRLEVLEVDASHLAVRGAFEMDDPLYYNKKAKTTPAKFFAVFAKGAKGQLWAPF